MKYFFTAALILSSNLAFAQSDTASPCMHDREFSLNGVKFFGPSAAIGKHFGKPSKIKKWYRESDGNEGSYFVNDYIYPNVIFSARIGKGEHDRVQVIKLLAPSLSINQRFHLGMSKAELEKILVNYKAKSKLENATLSVFSCEDDAGSVTINFHFDKAGLVDKLKLEYDSDAI